MKKLLPWLKANLIGVVALVLGVIAAPVMVFFARGWEKRLHDQVEGQVSGFIQQLSSSDVSYSVDPYLAGQEPISVKAPPNEATTNAVAGLLQAVVKGSEAVRQKAIEINSADKPLLIQGATPAESLFPENKDESTRLRLLDQLVDRWPKAHAELLSEFRAGGPPDQPAVRTTLTELRTKEIGRRTTGGGESSLTPEEQAQIALLLGKTRLELYRQAATEIRFYADKSAFAAVQPWDKTKVMPMPTAWEWQMDYWVHRDIIKALSLANSDDIGAFRPVFLGPVKMLESIALSKGGADKSSEDDAPAPASASQGGGDPSAEVQRNYAVSLSGRAAAPVAPNPLYDIVYADVVIVASASRLPKIVEAFPRVNFMTVVDLDIEEFDAVPALSAGYDFGSDHVVRVAMRIETLWLRSWVKQWMPPEVRKKLGIPDDQPPPADAGESKPG